MSDDDKYERKITPKMLMALGFKGGENYHLFTNECYFKPEELVTITVNEYADGYWEILMDGNRIGESTVLSSLLFYFGKCAFPAGNRSAKAEFKSWVNS